VLWAFALNCVILKKARMIGLSLEHYIHAWGFPHANTKNYIFNTNICPNYPLYGCVRLAPAVATPVVVVLVERILWWSYIRFRKTFDKTASPNYVKWIRG
jgi:hypothetical protein